MTSWPSFPFTVRTWLGPLAIESMVCTSYTLERSSDGTFDMQVTLAAAATRKLKPGADSQMTLPVGRWTTRRLASLGRSAGSSALPSSVLVSTSSRVSRSLLYTVGSAWPCFFYKFFSTRKKLDLEFVIILNGSGLLVERNSPRPVRPSSWPPRRPRRRSR